MRGFRASISRSTMRLNPIAANRAHVNASTIQPTIGQRDRRAIRREHHADERERQREHRVRQLHEVRIDQPARPAVRERLSLAARTRASAAASLVFRTARMPSDGHIASTGASSRRPSR